MVKTYRATILVAVSQRNVHAVLVLAGTTQVVSNDLHVEVEVSGCGRLILEDGDPGRAVPLADANVDRGPVADVAAAVSPLASLFGGNSLGVDIVLGRSGHALPAVVFTSIGAGQRVSGTGGRGKGNDFGFGT